MMVLRTQSKLSFHVNTDTTIPVPQLTQGGLISCRVDLFGKASFIFHLHSQSKVIWTIRRRYGVIDIHNLIR